ncbi:nicotinate-nucleotide adenylyltransferase [Iamia majanohamensis]|uniref:Probable nicotinate-nucleotide adenylyltransferase n=1 Tax=Iamia majanohamensis TaxID=467976 RepID=A0AAE9YCY9_9ACTN|nr:nicotinate-nucleotide adenylyltransferase [Iamia majanohamensis]WCO68908.1 nicotinate-nucleotide adenylyltransferase [Iamia majanohamensis]
MTLVTGGGRRRIGLLGGTFDPPHIGHLRVAVAVRHALDLDEVLLVPNGDPWQKRDARDLTPAALRLEMVDAATEALTPTARVAVSDVEVRRPGPSYTADTVSQLQGAEPGLEVIVVLGRDAAELLPTWERLDEVLDRAVVAVVDRPGAAAGPLSGVDPSRVVAVEVEQLAVSSSGVRDLVAEGAPIDVLVPPGVAAVIAREGLYRGRGGRHVAG